MAEKLQVKQQAPHFSLPRDGGGSVALKDYNGQRLVIYFYPKADTSGCTKEAITFEGLANRFKAAKTSVIGVSPDPVPALDKFKAKYALTFPLVSDVEKAMLEAYGVWTEKSMYGRKYMGILRTTFVIDEHGRVARIFEKVRPKGHAAQVLEAVQ